MKEYGRKPYIAKTYRDMMDKTPNKALWDEYVEKHSEFEKPYKNDSYSEMQYYHPPLPGISGDYPGMDSWSSLNFNQIDPIDCSMLWRMFVEASGSMLGSMSGFFSQMVAGCPTILIDEDECPGFEYTTNQMAVDETQQFSIPEECDDCEWEITSGGGSISETGLYTAPSDNEDCVNNPTVVLMCNGETAGELKIAVNAASDYYGTAYTVFHGKSEETCSWTEYWCSGEIRDTGESGACFVGDPCTTGAVACSDPDSQCGPATCDNRSSTAKTAGCCPAALL